MICLTTDVLLLADVLENFVSKCITQYKLDQRTYLTSPGLAWDAMLRMTNVELDLIADLYVLKTERISDN